MEGQNHRLRLVKSELETGLIFGTGSRTGTEMCLLEEVYISVGQVPGLEGYNNGPFVLQKSNLIFGTNLEDMYLFEEVNEVPPKFNFFLFNEQKKGLAHHSKK